MITKNIVKEQLMSEMSRRNIDLVTQIFIDKPEDIYLLIEITLSHEEKVSTRASWALEKLSIKLKEPALEFLDAIITELPNIKISGTRRTITKVLTLHTIPESLEGKLLDFCITMIETPSEPVAVKANCMTIIFNLLPKYPELKNELFAIIENQIPHSTGALKGRYNILRKKFMV